MSPMGQIIKDLRKKNGFTQEELAERLGVTYQAVSKWENGTGMPDISQVVPLASIFKVSTDVLFGIADTTENEEARKIVQHADRIKKYGEAETYLKAYDILLDGLKKYPDNPIIMINCMNLGVSLSSPENGWVYAEEPGKRNRIRNNSPSEFHYGKFEKYHRYSICASGLGFSLL